MRLNRILMLTAFLSLQCGGDDGKSKRSTGPTGAAETPESLPGDELPPTRPASGDASAPSGNSSPSPPPSSEKPPAPDPVERVPGAAWSCGTGGKTGRQVQISFQDSLYYITTPRSYSKDKAWPLVIGLHGDEGDPAKSVNYSWRSVANNQFIFVAPKAKNQSGSWYEDRKGNSQWLDAMLAEVQAKYNIDRDRIYIWGLSGGAVMISSYAMERQKTFAAVQFNMGGSLYGWRGAGYPSPKDCAIPARFVVAEDDFLRKNARPFYEELAKRDHAAEWVDANCSGHCWDKVESGPGARDWLLQHTLCGTEREPVCGEAP